MCGSALMHIVSCQHVTRSPDVPVQIHRMSITPCLIVTFLLFSDTAYVRVFISDVNDNKPMFAHPSYEVDVDEDADVGFAIVTVSANDGDEGETISERYHIQRCVNGLNAGVYMVLYVHNQNS